MLAIGNQVLDLCHAAALIRRGNRHRRRFLKEHIERDFLFQLRPAVPAGGNASRWRGVVQLYLDCLCRRCVAGMVHRVDDDIVVALRQICDRERRVLRCIALSVDGVGDLLHLGEVVGNFYVDLCVLGQRPLPGLIINYVDDRGLIVYNHAVAAQVEHITGIIRHTRVDHIGAVGLQRERTARLPLIRSLQRFKRLLAIGNQVLGLCHAAKRVGCLNFNLGRVLEEQPEGDGIQELAPAAACNGDAAARQRCVHREGQRLMQEGGFHPFAVHLLAQLEVDGLFFPLADGHGIGPAGAVPDLLIAVCRANDHICVVPIAAPVPFYHVAFLFKDVLRPARVERARARYRVFKVIACFTRFLSVPAGKRVAGPLGLRGLSRLLTIADLLCLRHAAYGILRIRVKLNVKQGVGLELCACCQAFGNVAGGRHLYFKQIARARLQPGKLRGFAPLRPGVGRHVQRPAVLCARYGFQGNCTGGFAFKLRLGRFVKGRNKRALPDEPGITHNIVRHNLVNIFCRGLQVCEGGRYIFGAFRIVVLRNHAPVISAGFLQHQPCALEIVVLFILDGAGKPRAVFRDLTDRHADLRRRQLVVNQHVVTVGNACIAGLIGCRYGDDALVRFGNHPGIARCVAYPRERIAVAGARRGDDGVDAAGHVRCLHGNLYLAVGRRTERTHKRTEDIILLQRDVSFLQRHLAIQRRALAVQLQRDRFGLNGGALFVDSLCHQGVGSVPAGQIHLHILAFSRGPIRAAVE